MCGHRVWLPTADLEQFESERLDLGQHAVQRGLVRDGAAQQRVLALCLGAQGGERAQHGRAQVAADPDLVTGLVASWRLPVALLAGHRLTSPARREARVMLAR